MPLGEKEAVMGLTAWVDMGFQREQGLSFTIC